MIEPEGTLTGVGGVPLFWRAWRPKAEPRASVVLAHGGLEHSGRYAHVAALLVASGFAVYGFDFRGHGRSGGTPGRVDRIALLIDDLDRIVALAAAREPDRPGFIVAHSLGALVALEYVSSRGTSLAGMVLSGTGIDISAIPPLQAAFARALSVLTPGLGLVKLDSSLISRDPEIVRAYDADPLVFRGKAPVRTAAVLLDSARRMSSRLGDVTIPVLVLHGGADRIASPDGARSVHAQVSSIDKRLTVYDGLSHEIFNEPEQDRVIGDVVAWIERRC